MDNFKQDNLAKDDGLGIPLARKKQQRLMIAAGLACGLFLLAAVLVPYARSSKSGNLNIVQQSKDIADEVLTVPKSIKNQSLSGAGRGNAQARLDEDDDIQKMVQKKQDHREAFEQARLLARIETARVKAEEREKMNGSSVLSGMGAGSVTALSTTQTSVEQTDAKTYENGNTAFLARAGSSPVKEEEAGLIGDLRLRITEGKVIKGVVDSAIDSDLPGPIRAHVTEDVYGDQGALILIPNGAKIVGQYRSGSLKNGQTRVYIAWTRLIEPNGVSINLASSGSDDLGRAGMTGKVDKHVAERFGGAMLTSLLSAGAATYGVGAQDEYNSMSQYRSAVSQTFGNMASHELSESARIQPTIRINQGTPLSIIVGHDISFESVLQQMGVRL